MNILLIFFAIPFVVIVISIALQKILKCPILVAAIIFSISLLIAIILSSTTLIIASIFYGILSFIVAFIVCIINRIIRNINRCNNTVSITSTLNQDSVETVSSDNESISNSINCSNSNRNYCDCWRRR